MILAALLLAQAAAAPNLAEGRKVFDQSCAVGYCHGAGGEANRGPKLRGRVFEAAYLDRVVRKGIPNTAMPGFDGRLEEPQILSVLAYVRSISITGPSTTSAGTPAPVAAAPTGAAKVAESRGAQLFFDASREIRCGTCHEWNGRGLRIAPDPVGAAIPQMVKEVRRVRLKNGESFPALVAWEDDKVMRLYDLTQPPPVLRTFDRSQVESLAAETQWKHADVTRAYSAAELAEITRELSAVKK